MLKEKSKARVYIGLLVAVVLLIAALVVWGITRTKDTPQAEAVAPRATPEIIVKERLVDKLVEVKKEITAEEIRGGLTDMGRLITQEYYFTDVLQYSSVKTLFKIDLPITESYYLATYDGVVTAGIDFGGIEVEKDAESGVVTVTLPRAEIMNVDIDPKSFVLHSEKTGLGNPMSVADFNSSLVELEQSARQKALDRGLLTNAEENAKKLILNFVAGLDDSAPVSIRFAA